MSDTAIDAQVVFAELYDTTPGIRELVLQALNNVGASLEEYEDPVTWAECLATLQDMLQDEVVVEFIQCVAGQDFVIYPLAEYGWDGGNPISSTRINLTDLVSSNIQNGPYATLVRQTNTTYPGLAFHHIVSDDHLTIQFFWPYHFPAGE